MPRWRPMTKLKDGLNSGGSKIPRPEEINWPQNMGIATVKLMVTALIQAAMTFPIGTGLGWDGLHPRTICRLSESTLEWLAKVLYHCETTSECPEAVDIVIIALLPKSDEGLRPTGLIPFLVRLWCRARKEVTTQWEKLNHHPLLYAGKGIGADVAAG